MAVLTPQLLVPTGLSPSFVAAAATGDIFPNDDRTFVVVKNGDASSHTVTIAKQRNVAKEGYGTITLSDISVVVPPTSGEVWIAVPPGQYNASGQAQMTYDDVTSVTVAVVKRPQD